MSQFLPSPVTWPRLRASRLYCILLVLTVLCGGSYLVRASVALPALVTSDLDPKLKGHVLIEELKCAACHPAEAAVGERSKTAPRLAAIGSRVNPDYVQSLLLDPQAVHPGTTMPDVLSHLPTAEKSEVATALTHFLFSRQENDFSLRVPDAVAAGHGHRLFQARGCTACHSPRDASGVEVADAAFVPMGALERKYSFDSLVRFLRDPHASRPSGRMPDMRLPGQDLERIAHFLLQNTRVPGALGYTLYRGKVWEGLGSDEVKPERSGQVQDFNLKSFDDVHHHSAIVYTGWINLAAAGKYTFFLTLNGGSVQVDETVILEQAPSDRRGVKQLEAATELAAGRHRLRITYFHTGHEPSFSCELAGPQHARQPVPSSWLSASEEVIPVLAPLPVDAGLAARGREYFGKFGCASCHDDLGVSSLPAPALAGLDASRGCLSQERGPWPAFDLDDRQRELVARALPEASRLELDDRQKLEKSMVTFNCGACHERKGLSSLSPDRKALFTGSQPALGDQGRVPPPLSDAGAKLTKEWLRDVLLHGQRQRDYLDASMPQFGEANVGHLIDLFGQVDTLEAATLPPAPNILESKEAGYEMTGTTGFGCIACHTFNGQKSGEVSALDITQLPRRLQKNWFHLYMREPTRFHPTVIMPNYWPDGRSTRPTILGGDTTQQIEALWAYLEDGPRARKPLGLSRESNELRVGDVTEVCRGQSAAGYRGIAAGYPERLNLAFDSGEMALRQLWKGEFASVDYGSFSARGTDHISFPPGVPFHRLQSLEDNWPYKGKTNYSFPQDHGYQFRGYHLDASRRPSWLYQFGDISVQDYFEDVRDAKDQAYFKRTLRFDAPAGQLPFYFRAATGQTIVTHSEREFSSDRLRLRITSDHRGLVRPGDPGEVLILLSPPEGRSTLTLEYQW